MMATRDVRAHVCTRCPVAFLQSDHLTNPASATLLTISFVMCSPIPQIHKTHFRDVSVWELAGLFLLRRFFRSIGHGLKTMFLPSWSAWVFSLSAFLQGPCNDLASVLGLVGLLHVVFIHDVLRHTPMSHGWCHRPGARRSSPCRFSMTIGHGHAVVCLLELGNGY